MKSKWNFKFHLNFPVEKQGIYTSNCSYMCLAGGEVEIEAALVGRREPDIFYLKDKKKLLTAILFFDIEKSKELLS